MKLTTLAAVVAVSLLTTLTVGERECPIESDCIQKLCKKINFKADGSGNRAFTMEAYCKNEAGAEIYTTIDLKKCIANRDGFLQWSPDGDFRCMGCRLFQTSPESYVGLRCHLCPRKNTFWRGYSWTWLDLSRGIWVNKNGALGCYDHQGEWAESLRKIQKKFQ